jgi:hypothetical protein
MICMVAAATPNEGRTTKRMQATARRLSVVSATSCARRRLIRDVDMAMLVLIDYGRP